MPTRHRRGFTFTDLVVGVAVVAFLAALAAPAVRSARSSAFRDRCVSNLRQIAAAMLNYAESHRGNYPRTTYVPGAPPTEFTGSAAANPFAADGPAPNDVSAALFLLLRTQHLSPEVFVCPTTAALVPWDLGGKPAAAVSNFPAGLHLGYSVANPYPDPPAVALGYKWNNTLGAEFAIASDMNPGGPDLGKLAVDSSPAEMLKGNTRNERGRRGQCVLFGDGHVEFVQNPFCGTRRDNIFTVAGATDGSAPNSPVVVGSPRWAGDSVLLPVATVDPKGRESPEDVEGRKAQTARWMTWGSVISVAAVALTAWYRRRRRGPFRSPRVGPA